MLYELVGVLGGTAAAFAAFETDMRLFGACVVRYPHEPTNHAGMPACLPATPTGCFE